MLIERSDGPALEYDLRGTAGPWVILPQCNERWDDAGYPNALGASFRVLVASPRGCFGSERADPADYSPECLLSDLLAAADHVGAERFAIWGYSLTSALAAFAATESDRVSALITGGFPIMSGLAAVANYVEDLVKDQPREPPGSPLDLAVATNLYRGLARRALDRDLGRTSCPRLAYSGCEDQFIALGRSREEEVRLLADAGFVVSQFEGLDHATCLTRSDLVLPVVLDFLRSAGLEGEVEA